MDVCLILGFRIRKLPWPPIEAIFSNIIVTTIEVIYLSSPAEQLYLIFNCFRTVAGKKGDSFIDPSDFQYNLMRKRPAQNVSTHMGVT